jgi:hypothetical protein
MRRVVPTASCRRKRRQQCQARADPRPSGTLHRRCRDAWRRGCSRSARRIQNSRQILMRSQMLSKVLDWFGLGDARAPDAQGEQGHSHGGAHGHTHGVMDATIATSDRGIWAIKWSFAILVATAILQLIVVFASSSVALLADTIHNIADATTGVATRSAPLCSARPLGSVGRPASSRFSAPS